MRGPPRASRTARNSLASTSRASPSPVPGAGAAASQPQRLRGPGEVVGGFSRGRAPWRTASPTPRAEERQRELGSSKQSDPRSPRRAGPPTSGPAPSSLRRLTVEPRQAPLSSSEPFPEPGPGRLAGGCREEAADRKLFCSGVLRGVRRRVSGEQRAQTLRNKESVAPAPLTFGLGLATAPLCLRHHKMSPSPTFPRPSLVPREASVLGL